MALEWALGEIWIFDSQDRVLKCSEVWHIPSIEVVRICKDHKANYLLLPVVVCLDVFYPVLNQSGLRMLSMNQSFQRAEIAAKVGLHGAFGFPILSGSEVLGTISFYSHEIRKPDEELLDMMTAIGSQIGLFIKRKQAEEELITGKTGS